MQEEAAAAANKAGSEVTPNQTIYINNLNEKVKLDGNIFFFLYNFDYSSSFYLLEP